MLICIDETVEVTEERVFVDSDILYAVTYVQHLREDCVITISL